MPSKPSRVLIDISERLSDIHAEQVRQGLEQVRQGVVLEAHERRSTNLELRVVPIERHVSAWSGVGKALTVLGTLGGIVAAVIKLLS